MIVALEPLKEGWVLGASARLVLQAVPLADQSRRSSVPMSISVCASSQFSTACLSYSSVFVSLSSSISYSRSLLQNFFPPFVLLRCCRHSCLLVHAADEPAHTGSDSGVVLVVAQARGLLV